VENKNYFFLSGLPRSGATLLSSLLNQNLNFYSGPDSPVCGTMALLEEYLNNQNEQLMLYPVPEFIDNIIKDVPKQYYQNINKPYIVDKTRIWNNNYNINLIKKYITERPKIICCVRSINEVLASYISLIHRNNKESFVDKSLREQGYPTNDVNRCNWLMNTGGLIDISLHALYESVNSSNSQHCLIVEYNDLISNTDSVMSSVYEFLEVEHFQHTYTNIKNEYRERDFLLGLDDMHDVRPTIDKISKNPVDILPSSIYQQYHNREFWR
jgi:sulfotransferase